MADSRETSPVLLFDGECGLCNRLVRLLLRLDRRGRLRFAALQSPPAQEYLIQQGLPTRDFESLVFVPDWNDPNAGGPRQRTAGALSALRGCGGWGRIMAAVIGVVPPRARDAAYRLVGRMRYRWFGVWRPRPLPRPEWAARFLGA